MGEVVGEMRENKEGDIAEVVRKNSRGYKEKECRGN